MLYQVITVASSSLALTSLAMRTSMLSQIESGVDLLSMDGGCCCQAAPCLPLCIAPCGNVDESEDESESDEDEEEEEEPRELEDIIEDVVDDLDEKTDEVIDQVEEEQEE